MSKGEARKRRMRTSHVIQRLAAELRKSMTPAEKILWNAMRGRGLANLKVRRQYPVDRFVLDFYIPECKLAIEVDGDIHIAQPARDDERTAVLAANDISVLRFTNAQVLTDLQGVLSTIRERARDSQVK